MGTAMTLKSYREKARVDIIFHRTGDMCYASGKDAKLLAKLCEDVTIKSGRAEVSVAEIDDYLDALSAVGLRVMLVADPIETANREAA